jgi:Predicted membrane protein (DUF2232)
MMQVFLIGIGAGAVAALMFAALASGSLLAVALFYLAPLPILIAALGWSHLAGLVAALTGSAGLFASFNAVFALVFLIGIGLPAWWLGYLCLLARPSPAGASDQIEWYPVGRLAFWAALLGAVIVAAAIPQFGADAESVRAALKSGFERVFQTRSGAPADEPLKLPGGSDANLVFELFAVVIPPAAAALTTATLLFNMWLAGRVVRLSGRLRRPWPDLSTVALPAYAAAIFALAAAGSFLPSMIGIIAGLFAASLAIAYMAHGLAVLHALTAPLRSRAIVLTGVYAAILIFGWPLLAIALLGLADALLDFRGRRAARKSGPPPARLPDPD